MSQNANIVVLTTRQNSSWVSMQEIIPSLESLWTAVTEDTAVLINCDELDLKSCLKDIMKADFFVVTAFNVSIARTLVLLRKKMGIDTPWIFYLHNQATIGLWPLFHWGMGDLLTTDDQFVSTCQNDARCFDLLFENKKAVIIPFYFFPLQDTKVEENAFQLNDNDFVFIGRISSQKNLHTLIQSFSLLKSQAKLHFFGSEDGLGSPNMGFQDKDYLKLLKKLVAQNGLEERIVFHGFVAREIIESVLKQKDIIFVGPSIHSDENFGMAALRALMHGRRAVLSAWGGHEDFGQFFTQQVFYCDVYQSDRGPYINVNELSQTLEKAQKSQLDQFIAPFYYEKDYSKNLCLQLLEFPDRGKALPLRKTELLLETLKRIETHQSWQTGKIFEGYQDKLALQYFAAYGAKIVKKKSEGMKTLLPWVQKADQGFEAFDPHRGRMKLSSWEELEQSGLCY